MKTRFKLIYMMLGIAFYELGSKIALKMDALNPLQSIFLSLTAMGGCLFVISTIDLYNDIAPVKKNLNTITKQYFKTLIKELKDIGNDR